jgi:PST family polysaccharide transporter
MTSVSREAVPAHSAESMKAGAVSGAVLMAIAQGIKFVTQLVSTIVLSRMLSPHDFGIFAMIMPLVALVMLFQDFGLSQAVISVREITTEQETTLFLINIALSIALALLFAAAAPLIGTFYHTQEVVAPTMALACTIVLSGLASLQFGFLSRDLKFKALSVCGIVGPVAGLAASIIVAAINPSPWAMVASVVANMTFGLTFGWLATGWRPKRPAPFAEVLHFLNFGGGVIASNVANLITRNSDNILIARYLGANPLGFYDRAYKLLLFPVQQIISPLGQVILPVLSRLAGEADRYRAAYFRSLDQILLVSLPGMVTAIILADDLVPFAMGEKWNGVVPVFRWLGLVGLHLPLSETLPWLLMSQSRTGLLARIAIFRAVTSVIGFVIGLRYGILGVAAIYAITDIVIRLPSVIWLVGRTGPVSTRQIVSHAFVHVLGMLVAAGLLLGLKSLVALDHLSSLLAGTSLAYLGAWSTIGLFPSRRPVFVELIGMLLGVVQGSKQRAFGSRPRPINK